MRFSIRWLLGAVAYMALVMAAAVSGIDLLAAAVWFVSFCAICYAVVMSFIAKDKQRAMAIGFVVLAVGNIVGLYLVPRQLPAVRLLSVIGYGFDSDDGSLYVRNAFTADGRNRGVPSRRSIPGSRTVVKTANAVGTMLAGVIGAGIGALAYKNASRD